MKRTKRVRPTPKRVKDTQEKDIRYTREQLEELIPIKQRLFCKEYCTNAWNGTKAYRKAYEYQGNSLSDNTCASNANKLLRKTKIKQYIEYLKGDLESLTGVSKERNLRELAKIAYSGIAHLHNTWVDLKEYDELTEDQLAAIKDTEVKTIYTEKGSEITTVKITLHPKLQAIETINKMMGYNAQESVKMEQTVTNKIDITKYSDEEKALLLKMARKNEYQ